MPDYDELWELYRAKEREVDSLRRQVATLQRQLVTMQDEHMAELAKANERIAELLVLVERGKKRSTEKKERKAADPPPELTDEQRAAFESRPAPPEPRGSAHDHPRPKQKPTGRKRLPESLPADVSERRPERCACGCEDFIWVDEVVEEKLDVKAHQRRRVTHRHTGRCTHCGGEALPRRPHPPSPARRSRATGWHGSSSRSSSCSCPSTAFDAP